MLGNINADLEQRLQVWLALVKNYWKFTFGKRFSTLYISIAKDWIFWWRTVKLLSLINIR